MICIPIHIICISILQNFFIIIKYRNFDLAFREKACLKVCALGTLESQVEKLARQVETFAPRMARWHVNCTSTQARWHVNHAGTQITLTCRHTWHVNQQTLRIVFGLAFFKLLKNEESFQKKFSFPFSAKCFNRSVKHLFYQL